MRWKKIRIGGGQRRDTAGGEKKRVENLGASGLATLDEHRRIKVKIDRAREEHVCRLW